MALLCCPGPSMITALQKSPGVGTTAARITSTRPDPGLFLSTKHSVRVRSPFTMQPNLSESKPCRGLGIDSAHHDAAEATTALHGRGLSYSRHLALNKTLQHNKALLTYRLLNLGLPGLALDGRQRKLWSMAIKLPMYMVAVVPVLVSHTYHLSFCLPGAPCR